MCTLRHTNFQWYSDFQCKNAVSVSVVSALNCSYFRYIVLLIPLHLEIIENTISF